MSNPGPFLNVPVARGAALIVQRTSQTEKPQFTFTGFTEQVGLGVTESGSAVLNSGGKGSYLGVSTGLDAGTLPLGYDTYAVTSTNSVITIALPDGEAVGQRLVFVCVANGSADVLLNSAKLVGGNQIQIDAVNETVVLEWKQLGASTFKWVPTTVIGAVIATV